MNFAFVSGFSLGLSLIMAIGAQNAFVLRQGIRGEHVFAVALVCALSDAVLIAIGVSGAGAAIALAPFAADLMRWAGATFLVFYGARSFWRAFRQSESLEPVKNKEMPFWSVLGTACVLTWANPHVYLDTVVLLGSVSVQYGDNAYLFGMGAITSSFVFFFALAYGAQALRAPFANPISWRILDAFIGVVMWTIALKLVVG